MFTAISALDRELETLPSGGFSAAFTVYLLPGSQTLQISVTHLAQKKRSLGNPGLAGVQSENAGPRIDKTIWEKCMRALHVRLSGRAC